MSADDGSLAPTLTVNSTPTVAVVAPVTTATGALLVTVSVVVADVADTASTVTCTATACESGPLSMPSASSCAQVRVGATPVASVKTPSPLTSQAYVPPGVEPDASRVSASPSAT